MTTWRREIAVEMAKHGEGWEDAVRVNVARLEKCSGHSPDAVINGVPECGGSHDISGVVDDSDAQVELDREFDAGNGTPKGTPFLVWTTRRVYFPASYDGEEWVVSLPRDPCEEVHWHVG